MDFDSTNEGSIDKGFFATNQGSIDKGSTNNGSIDIPWDVQLSIFN